MNLVKVLIPAYFMSPGSVIECVINIERWINEEDSSSRR